MSTDDFRAQARIVLERLIGEYHTKNNDALPALLDSYADELTRLYGEQSHQMLNEIIEEARTRLDARLSPDPLRQTIATVQTTVQDLWKNLWQ
jgi:lauroyl/myristoyl acyltransferase